MSTQTTLEVAHKLEKLRSFMAEQHYDVIRIQTPNLFAWLTGGGRNHIDITSDWTGAALFITQSKVVCVMAENEKARVWDEELASRLECEIRTYPWWGWADNEVQDLYEGAAVAGDMAFPHVTPISEELRSLFYPLVPDEVERYRQLARDVSDAFYELMSHIRQGMTEFEIDGLLSGLLRRQGINPNVLMVAADDRAPKYMHPLATDNKLEAFAVISVCASRGGLVVSMTRSVHIGEPDGELLKKHRDASYIAAQLEAHTVDGADLGELFQFCLKTYEELGLGDAWKKHTIGGKTGYRTREFSVGPYTEGKVEKGTVWGWNPTVNGTKSEDTVWVGDDGAIPLHEDKRWPQLSFEINGKIISKPGIYII
ncbi:M24 family metallopeptidase [Paenibacillus nasutitermitis]|uniref:Peptidase M24 n=1 Tax=Paenibacillus nasutitermitis TaxID=1652958 RepID=A0A916Z5L4_9BACL|nr:M24 family metallopeptidase [Paenibacillus nasutitermitis]GGD77891.1 peptidase M24 [Paenibacillus nasutitermitis]